MTRTRSPADGAGAVESGVVVISCLSEGLAPAAEAVDLDLHEVAGAQSHEVAETAHDFVHAEDC